MNDGENLPELNGSAADPLSGSTPENNCENPSGSKRGPPVAPKPAWFRQSLRKIQHEQEQRKQSGEQQCSNRSFGIRSASSSACLSIKQKINSFESFSSPQSPEKGDTRRPEDSCTSLRENGKNRIQFSAPPAAVTSISLEDCSLTKASSTGAEPPSTRASGDVSLSESTQTSPKFTQVHSVKDASPSKAEQQTEKLRSNISACTGLISAREESPPEGSEGERRSRTSNDSNPVRSLDEESLEKILTFSNQVFH